MSDRIPRLAERFDAEFADPGTAWRTLGREAEHPVVDASGRAADIQQIRPHLQAPGDLEPVWEGDLLVGLVGPRFTYAAEVGRGTMEIISEPCADLSELASTLEEAQGRLVDAASREGLAVLGYGIQPLTPPSAELMTPKPRYGELLQCIGDDWLSFTTTASDQIHVSVGRSEWIAATNLANLMTPVAVALCANSPVQGGAASPWVSAREGTMGAIGVARHRHGMPGRAVTDAEDFVRQQAEMALLLRWRDGRKVATTGTFEDWLRDADDDPEGWWRGYLLHEHYIWHSARPRSAHSTLELRSACQQPPGETHAAAALSAGIVLAAPALAELVDDTFGGEAWPVLRAWHAQVLRDGLRAPQPVPGFVEEVLDRCDAALSARGRGEQVFLDPLRRRLGAGVSPAHEALAAFEAGGIEGLVAHARFQ